MIAKLIEADTRLDAWVSAAQLLLDNGPMLNLSLAIGSPATGGCSTAIDRFLADEDKFPMHTVAETIFPGVEYLAHGLPGVFDFYPREVYPAIKKHPSIRWGTYAYRLVRRRDADGRDINPLKQMIDKMQSEIRNAGSKRSCYELGIAEGEYDAPLYAPAQDGAGRMGGPCLSHLSFKLFHGAVHLTAFYRSHDYRYKVPGNLLGLARLQGCVAHETRQEIGSLVVHSSYAYLFGAKSKMQTLLNYLRRRQVQEEANDVVAH